MVCDIQKRDKSEKPDVFDAKGLYHNPINRDWGRMGGTMKGTRIERNETTSRKPCISNTRKSSLLNPAVSPLSSAINESIII